MVSMKIWVLTIPDGLSGLDHEQSLTQLNDINYRSPNLIPLLPSGKVLILYLISKIKLVERGGFEPPKASPTDLQSVPFGRSGIIIYCQEIFKILSFKIEKCTVFNKFKLEKCTPDF